VEEEEEEEEEESKMMLFKTRLKKGLKVLEVVCMEI